MEVVPFAFKDGEGASAGQGHFLVIRMYAARIAALSIALIVPVRRQACGARVRVCGYRFADG
jgi:hypothetical protein